MHGAAGFLPYFFAVISRHELARRAISLTEFHLTFNMKIVIALCALVVLASAAPLTEENFQYLFSKFAKEHKKEYGTCAGTLVHTSLLFLWCKRLTWGLFDAFAATTGEFFKAYNAFKDNMNYIQSHMSNPKRTFDVAMNQFGDMTNEEFRAKYNNYMPRGVKPNTLHVNVNTSNLPSSVDWPSKGVVTPVKNQGQCGSCWAFSTTGSIESAHAIKTGTLTSLSEQELVDCSGSAGNQGCNGGEMQAAFQWVEQNGGLCTESAYPYKAVDGTCQKSSCTSATTISGYKNVQQNSEAGKIQTILCLCFLFFLNFIEFVLVPSCSPPGGRCPAARFRCR